MELLSGHFNCDCCGKPVTVRDFDQILAWNKMCADCRVIDVTGGFKEKPIFRKKKPVKEFTGSLRREIGKKKTKKKPMAPEQREANRKAEDEKWDRVRYGYQNAYYKEHNIYKNKEDI